MSAAELLANYRAAHLRVTGRGTPQQPRVRMALIAPPVVFVPEELPAEPPPPPMPDFRRPSRRGKRKPRIVAVSGEWDHPLADSQPTARNIIRAVRCAYGLSSVDFFGSRRLLAIVFPRQLAMYLCRLLTRNSLPEIGRRLGGRDHTTVLHGAQKIQRLLEAAPPITLTKGMSLSEVVRLHREALEA